MKRRDGFGMDFCKSWNKCVAPRKGYVENLCYEFVREGLV
jgi:hypothetical protein